MNDDFISDIWLMFKEYCDKKHIEIAAEKFVDMLIDYGWDDARLIEMMGQDKYLDAAIQYNLELDDDYSEDEDWDE